MDDKCFKEILDDTTNAFPRTYAATALTVLKVADPPVWVAEELRRDLPIAIREHHLTLEQAVGFVNRYAARRASEESAKQKGGA